MPPLPGVGHLPQQLKAALIVNPNDKIEVAEAIREALQMSQEERVSR